MFWKFQCFFYYSNNEKYNDMIIYKEIEKNFKYTEFFRIGRIGNDFIWKNKSKKSNKIFY